MIQADDALILIRAGLHLWMVLTTLPRLPTCSEAELLATRRISSEVPLVSTPNTFENLKNTTLDLQLCFCTLTCNSHALPT